MLRRSRRVLIFLLTLSVKLSYNGITKERNLVAG